MSVILADCPQPPPINGGPRQCLSGDYCLCRVYAAAKRRCIARGEGWRWGVGSTPSNNNGGGQ